MPLKQHEADKLIDVIRELVAPTSAGKSDPKIVIEPKKCDHKFIDSNNCAKCGDHISSIERKQAPVGKALPSDDKLRRSIMEGTGNVGDIVTRFDDPKLEDLYQQFKVRLLEELPVDPVLLHLLTVRPEILVDVERRTINLDGTGSDLKGRIARLIAAGFLAEPRRAGAIASELGRTGTSPAGNRLTEALDWLKKAGFLILDGNVWIAAPGVKITERTLEA